MSTIDDYRESAKSRLSEEYEYIQKAIQILKRANEKLATKIS